MSAKHITRKQPGPYRVFVTRHYIAVQYYDVDAQSPADARRRAVKAARALLPDVRATATDNGWIADDPVFLNDGLGSSASGISKLKECAPGVYQHVESE